VVDKLKKISRPLSEKQLRPGEQVDLDDIEETLGNILRNIFQNQKREEFPFIPLLWFPP
jgi:hypothetical protein